MGQEAKSKDQNRSMLAVLIAATALFGSGVQGTTSTGRRISPVGNSVVTGGFPTNIDISLDRRFVAVVHGGTEQNLVILDTRDGHLIQTINFDGARPESKAKDGLYFGVRFASRPDGKTILFVSHGSADRVDSYEVGYDGRLKGPVNNYYSTRPVIGALMPFCLAGVATTSDGSRLFAVGNQSFALSEFQGSLTAFDTASPKSKKVVPLPAFPLDVQVITKGPLKDRKLYVSCERDGFVAVVNAENLKTEKMIEVGTNPTYMALDNSQRRLFVSCSSSDTVSVIDTLTDAVTATILVRPAAQRGLPGANPLGLHPSDDGKTLFVALSDLNAIAVIDVEKERLMGFIPTGWYPTSVVPVPSGLMVASAKGRALVNPNLPSKSATKKEMMDGDSGPNIRKHLKGELALIHWPVSTPQLKNWSTQVVANNHFSRITRPVPKRPGIDKVIYIVKENRSYDQFFGDFPEGNGQKELLLYGDDVIPNQRALAKRFGLYDNFYACAEMSADGWSWTTAGATSEYVQRNAQYDYSGHKREYDYEGQTNGTPSDAYGMRDVNEPAGGYLWDNALAHHIEFKNYGMYLAEGVNVKTKSGKPISVDNEPTKKAFMGRYDPDFRMFDLNYADSDLWDQLGKSFPKRRLSYGDSHAKSRFQAWKSDYQRLIKTNRVPPLMLVRFGNDHTQGTTPGAPTPSAMIADNDYAVGQLIDTVSHGPLWKRTAIVIIEDDAQGGYDHVDGHRSTCWIVSPWVKKGGRHHQFYNTDDALRTVEWLLGLPPTNQFTATARPIDCFGSAPLNSEPFSAIFPSSSTMVSNTVDAYRAADSAMLFNPYLEESAPDRELADILWHATRGRMSPTPRAKSLGEDQ